MDNRRGDQDYGFDDDREYRRNRGWDYEESFGRQYEPDDRDEYGSYPGRQRSSSYRSERDDYLSNEGDFDRDRGYRRYNSYERYEGPTGSRSEPYSNYRESGPRTYNYRQSSESRSGYREGYQPQRRDESDYPDYERLRRNIPRPREEYDEKQFDDLRGYTGPKR